MTTDKYNVHLNNEFCITENAQNNETDLESHTLNTSEMENQNTKVELMMIKDAFNLDAIKHQDEEIKINGKFFLKD